MANEHFSTERDHEILVTLRPEANWVDVAPVLDDLQDYQVVVRAEKTTLPVGGPGPVDLDLFPAAVTFLFGNLVGALVSKAVGDILYPALKDKLRDVYRAVSRRLGGKRGTAAARPLELGLQVSGLRAIYRFPEGLTDGQFASALGSVASHFAAISGRRSGVVVLDFNPSTGNWDVREPESQYLSQLGEHQVGSRDKGEAR